MSNKEVIEKDGVVKEALPDGKFIIKIESEERQVIGYISGKLRKFRIWIIPGDKVRVEFSPSDLNNCRITFRYK